MEKQVKGKIIEYDILRIVATLLVVIGHSAYFAMKDGAGGFDLPLGDFLTSKSQAIYMILQYITRWIYSFHMPLFFFLSGAVFGLKKINDYTFNNLLFDKVRRLIIPFILALFLFTIPIKTIAGFYDINTSIVAIKLALTDPISASGHLWFLIYLFWCFVIFYPIAKYLKNKEGLMLLICAVLMAISSNIPFINIVLWGNAFTYIFWFALGYVFNSYRERINEYLENQGHLFIAILGIISVFSVKWEFLNSFFQILVGICFVYGCCYYLSKYRKLHENKGYKFVSRNSFAIYLLHDPLNYILMSVLFTTGLYENFASWAFFSLYIFIRIFGNIFVCCLINEGVIRNLKHIGRLEKYLVKAKGDFFIFSLFVIAMYIAFVLVK